MPASSDFVSLLLISRFMLRSTYHYKNGCMFWVNQCCPVNLFTYRHRDKGSKDQVEQILCMSRSTPKTASHWLRHRTGHLTTSPARSFSQLSRNACTFQLDMYSLFCKSMPEASGACSLTYLIREILPSHAVRNLRSRCLGPEFILSILGIRAPRHC